jgi:hypothetical protein
MTFFQQYLGATTFFVDLVKGATAKHNLLLLTVPTDRYAIVQPTWIELQSGSQTDQIKTGLWNYSGAATNILEDSNGFFYVAGGFGIKSSGYTIKTAGTAEVTGYSTPPVFFGPGEQAFVPVVCGTVAAATQRIYFQVHQFKSQLS